MFDEIIKEFRELHCEPDFNGILKIDSDRELVEEWLNEKLYTVRHDAIKFGMDLQKHRLQYHNQ